MSLAFKTWPWTSYEQTFYSLRHGSGILLLLPWRDGNQTLMSSRFDGPNAFPPHLAITDRPTIVHPRKSVTPIIIFDFYMNNWLLVFWRAKPYAHIYMDNMGRMRMQCCPKKS